MFGIVIRDQLMVLGWLQRTLTKKNTLISGGLFIKAIVLSDSMKDLGLLGSSTNERTYDH